MSALWGVNGESRQLALMECVRNNGATYCVYTWLERVISTRRKRVQRVNGEYLESGE